MSVCLYICLSACCLFRRHPMSSYLGTNWSPFVSGAFPLYSCLVGCSFPIGPGNDISRLNNRSSALIQQFVQTLCLSLSLCLSIPLSVCCLTHLYNDFDLLFTACPDRKTHRLNVHYSHTHTHAHTHTHTDRPAWPAKCTHPHTHTHTHTHTHIYRHARAHTHTQTHTHRPAWPAKCTHTRTHTPRPAWRPNAHTHTPTHTHAHTRARARTYICGPVRKDSFMCIVYVYERSNNSIAQTLHSVALDK